MITARRVIAALAADDCDRSGWMQQGGQIIEPRTELFLGGEVGIWVRTTGRYASGWIDGSYGAGRFNRFDAWRIRRAIRRWDARRSAGDPQGAERAQPSADARPE